MPDPLNVVIDISHHNGNVNLAKAKEDGILGVIQKATQGQSFKDPTYQRNRQKAKDAGLLWGAYHFGTGSDGLSGCAGFIPMFVFGLRPSTIDSMSEGSLSQVWEMPAIAPTAQNGRRTDGAQPRCRQFSRAGHAPQRRNCLAGVGGFELRNVDANYPFERSHRFAGIHPNSGHREYSRLSCGSRNTQLGSGC